MLNRLKPLVVCGRHKKCRIVDPVDHSVATSMPLPLDETRWARITMGAVSCFLVVILIGA
jgi:hypothetical protein